MRQPLQQQPDPRPLLQLHHLQLQQLLLLLLLQHLQLILQLLLQLPRHRLLPHLLQ
jgi:hypothetical protein